MSCGRYGWASLLLLVGVGSTAAGGAAGPLDHSLPPSGSAGRAGGDHWAVEPPSIARAAPVMNADSSLSRNATNAAISSGPATRPVGFGAGPGRSPSAGAPSRRRYNGVSAFPVTSALTRTPRPAPSSAADRVRPTTTTFDARRPVTGRTSRFARSRRSPRPAGSP